MSVPKYRQKDSKVEFIRLLMELNIKLGKIVVRKPKKYRLNYGDRLIQTALDALELAIEGNSIYLSPQMPEEEFKVRRQCFLEARGKVKAISTMSYIYLELCKDRNEVSVDKTRRQEEYIGSTTESIIKCFSGVLKSDKQIYKGQKKQTKNFN